MAEFVFLVGAEVSKTELNALRRASARLLMHTWQHGKFPSTGRSGRNISIGSPLDGPGQQVIMADSSDAETLVRTLEMDNPVAPRKTVEWLAFHSRNL